MRRPYEVVREQTLLARAAGHHTEFYEGWAYPPLMLYVDYPLARLHAAVAGPVQATYPVQPSFFVSVIPLALGLLIRLPVIAADVACLYLLRALGAASQDVRWYAFNPLVLLVGVWTFDSVMIALWLLALVLCERGRWASAGAALACGTAAKFLPVLALPVLVVSALTRNAPWRTRLQLVARLMCAFAVVLGLLVWPVWAGVWDVLAFHAGRFTLGMTVQQLWRVWAWVLPNVDWQPRWQLYASALFGNLALPLTLLVAMAMLLWRPLGVRDGSLLMLLAFLLGSKLVNEPYALAPVALLTAVLAARPDCRLRACRTLLWSAAFAYAAIQIPIWSLFFSLARQVWPATGPLLIRWALAYQVFINEPQAALPYALLGTVFSGLLVYTAWFVWRPSPPLAHSTGSALSPAPAIAAAI